jgi:hypothetical protein
VDPVPDPLLLRKFDNAGNRTPITRPQRRSLSPILSILHRSTSSYVCSRYMMYKTVTKHFTNDYNFSAVQFWFNSLAFYFLFISVCVSFSLAFSLSPPYLAINLRLQDRLTFWTSNVGSFRQRTWRLKHAVESNYKGELGARRCKEIRMLDIGTQPLSVIASDSSRCLILRQRNRASSILSGFLRLSDVDETWATSSQESIYGTDQQTYRLRKTWDIYNILRLYLSQLHSRLVNTTKFIISFQFASFLSEFSINLVKWISSGSTNTRNFAWSTAVKFMCTYVRNI